MNIDIKIFEIISNVIGEPLDSIKLDSGIGDFPKWDSLGHMSILTAVQDEFDVEFEPEEMIDIENVGDIINLTKEKVG